ncbi:MAG: penicillin acylase family protein [Lewinellaceae bacterium]|nr:penicillin acylase family protein [Lewinellaceae bacterium]
MRFLPFLLSAALTSALLYVLGTPQKAGEQQLPPLGSFFSPFSGFWKNAEPANRAFVLQQPKINLKGLKGKVSVVYDDQLVPHIFADNTKDAYIVQGYITAQQRLWQMDINSRQTAGRLSEVLGNRTLEMDRLMRRRGVARAAETDWAQWQQSEPTRTMLEAYTEGVNQYIDQLDPADYPVEFKLLHYKPEHWAPVKTALIIESMIDALNNRDDDLESTNTLAAFGRDTFNYLFPEWFSQQKPVVADTGQWKNIHPDFSKKLLGDQLSLHSQKGKAERTLPSDQQPMNGSNNWAVSGTRTASGYPILCNDTHLPLRLPHVWFQVQIHVPNFNCYGINVPGVPGVVIGFNEDIAWGFTNVSQDVADWYKIDWTDASRTTYLVDGMPHTVEDRTEVFKVKGLPDVLDTVHYTVWGPVVYDFDPGQPLYNYAYRYSTHDAPHKDGLTHFFSINGGKTYQDYRDAIPGLDCLSQNVVYASKSGDIAITVQGNFPIRNPGTGEFLQDGSLSENAWHGYVPESDLPSMKNPSRGFVFSANQHSTSPTYPYYYTGHFDASRARRIYDRLESMQHVTIDSMKAIQMDNFSYRAGDALPVLLRLIDRNKLDEKEKTYLETIAAWDGKYVRGTTAPALFDMWFDSTYYKTWDEMDAYLDKGISMSLPNAWRFTEIMDKDPQSVFFDHPNTRATETAADIVLEGFSCDGCTGQYYVG